MEDEIRKLKAKVASLEAHLFFTCTSCKQQTKNEDRRCCKYCPRSADNCKECCKCVNASTGVFACNKHRDTYYDDPWADSD